ncbi:integrase core domain-containing protein [Nonomuraea sp. NPDC051941]|uniref:integrase core domain-containing protein n=1 Tax=Nonomuraea sp. NPDC051941 TaxID=3364373 RepID=UPI0037CAD9D0
MAVDDRGQLKEALPRADVGDIADQLGARPLGGEFDAVLADAGVRVVTSGVRIPRMNSIVERWIQICRLELQVLTLIWNERHLLHALREFETSYNEHRPHRALWQAAPLRSLPDPDTGPARTAPLDIRRHDRLGGVLKEYRRAA